MIKNIDYGLSIESSILYGYVTPSPFDHRTKTQDDMLEIPHRLEIRAFYNI